MTLRLLLILAALAAIALPQSWGQNENAIQGVFLKRAAMPIILDGKLDESAWFQGAPARDFWEHFPTDSTQAAMQTEVYMTYDDEYLYVGAICYTLGQDYVIPSLRRDYRAGGNDNITFLFDPFNDRTNAFVFGANPLGVLREALIFNGGQDGGRDFDESWDNKWKGASSMQEGYWSCELAIPFRTLRFKEGAQEWNFNCYRFDMQSNARTVWSRIPQNQSVTNLAFMGKMYWDEPLAKAGSGASIIPYATAGYHQDFEQGGSPGYRYNLGGDAKIAISSGMNLDLTVNPDFSQVEVDEQIVNLDRFELFFPERRQFFLENSDLFGGFGFTDITPFFSRRIGVGLDTATGQNIQNPIYFGARLSGKLDNNWRLGLLNMQTAPDAANGLPSFNYGIAALQRKVFSRSNVGFILVNKQAIGKQDTSELHAPFNRVAGLDYNLASSDNRWNGKAFLHRSFTPAGGRGQLAHGARLEYRVRDFSLSWEHRYVDEDFNAEVGFVRRKDYFSISPVGQWFLYPTGSAFNQHSLGLAAFNLWTPGTGRTDHRYELFWRGDFRNTASIRVSAQQDYTFLLEGFDPTGTSLEQLPGLTGYTYHSIRAFYSSDSRPKLSFSLSPSAGQYFNGHRLALGGGLVYRYQPYGAIRLSANYNYIDLPTGTASIFLIGPRIDLTFSRSIFLTVFLQYNDQLDNINLNTRLQWRFAPVSDFFLVYTDNYFPAPFGLRNRSLVAKATYWLNT